MKFLIFLTCSNILFIISNGAPLPNGTDHPQESDEDLPDLEDGRSSEEGWSDSDSASYEHGAPEDEPSGQANDQFPFKEYQNESSNYYVIDDMIVRKDPARAGLRDASWPEGIVPYSFQYSIGPSQRQQIMQAMKEIMNVVPCVKFRPITKTDTYNIDFRSDPTNQGCSSFVGWQNRKNQPIQLAPICSKGNAVHEIMHALGFFHEQTRDDRDTYVKINFENIQAGAENNFKKDKELYPDAATGYFDVPYNYDSIMHYGKTYFSKNGQNTIDVLKAEGALGNGDAIGQRDYISEGDITMMRAKYNCPAEPEPEQPQPELPAEEKTTTENQNAETAATEPETQTETPSPEEGEATTVKTTKSPMCQVYPNSPSCKP